jgi:hypothetical protein
LSLYVALVHGPVRNKHGEPITTAVTGLNLHDIARAVTTYGGAGYYLVTPLAAQQALVRRMMDHWREGHGADYNPTRKAALEGVRIADTLDDAVADVAGREGTPPRIVATSARERPGVPRVDYAGLRADLAAGKGPVLLVFGTGWGLMAEVLEAADVLLPPLSGPAGPGGFNHLSVRSAVSIVLDRLLGTGP